MAPSSAPQISAPRSTVHISCSRRGLISPPRVFDAPPQISAPRSAVHISCSRRGLLSPPRVFDAPPPADVDRTATRPDRPRPPALPRLVAACPARRRRPLPAPTAPARRQPARPPAPALLAAPPPCPPSVVVPRAPPRVGAAAGPARCPSLARLPGPAPPPPPASARRPAEARGVSRPRLGAAPGDIVYNIVVPPATSTDRASNSVEVQIEDDEEPYETERAVDSDDDRYVGTAPLSEEERELLK
ncbi:atherin-like [Panicum virgatum]|uniref:atherin-like n=1 Tax=Panicum virgatum TaxID=38727 RepID=UPI0019D63A3C|nr:atherin-like [Panicum virgatum]